MMVRCPVKPSLRKASAARSPAREAPTMTMRPVLLNAATRSPNISFVEAFTTLHPLFCRLDVRPRWLAPGRLQRRAGPSSVWHRRVGVVHQRFLTVQFEDGGSEKGTL